MKRKHTFMFMIALSIAIMTEPVTSNFAVAYGIPVEMAITAEAATVYYAKCRSNCSSIVDGLKSIGVDSSYSNRKKIAQVNGINNYSGTAAQNTKLLNLLKQGKLIKSVTPDPVPSTSSNPGCYPKCKNSCGSIVDGLKSIGVDSSYSNRKKIAQANGISNYTGTASQNTKMLNLLKQGQLKKVGSTNSQSNTSTTSNAGTQSSNSTTITYAPYTGVNYSNQRISSQRIKALNAAKEMVTIKWTCPATFVTWCSSTGGYNTVKDIYGKSDTRFIKGRTYTGIPYSMLDHSYDVTKWKNALSSGKVTTAFMQKSSTYSHKKTTTAHGMDCSYFVYLAMKAGVGDKVKYQPTSTMLNQSIYTKIKRENMKPGDIFLKSGHVMLYVGKSGGNYAVFEATANGSKCAYNVYSTSALSSYGSYRCRYFND